MRIRLLDTITYWRQKQQMRVWREVWWFYVLIFLVWGTYRLVLFRLPVWFEEIVLKAFVFGIPVVYLSRKHRWSFKDLGITGKNFFQSVYLGLGLGVILGFMGQLGNLVRHGTLVFQDFGLTSEQVGGFLILALITAFWEQLVFVGYFLQRVKPLVGKEQTLMILIGMLFALLHVPALLVQGMVWQQLLLSVLLLILLGMGNVILMLRTNNLIAPIMAQALWGITVYLFR